MDNEKDSRPEAPQNSGCMTPSLAIFIPPTTPYYEPSPFATASPSPSPSVAELSPFLIRPQRRALIARTQSHPNLRGALASAHGSPILPWPPETPTPESRARREWLPPLVTPDREDRGTARPALSIADSARAPPSTSAGREGHGSTVKISAPVPTAAPKSREQKLTYMLDQLDLLRWSVADFLDALFRLEDEHGNSVKRTQRHGLVVWNFLGGRTRVKPIRILGWWLKDPTGRPKQSHAEAGLAFAPANVKNYGEIAHAFPAMTSMAVQLVAKRLKTEQAKAVRGESGLHGSAVGKRGHRVLCWADIGSHTAQTVNNVFAEHQPLTLALLTQLAQPRARRNEDGSHAVRGTRPPDLVATEALSMLNFSHTKFARLLPAAKSVMFFASGVPRTLFNYSSRVGSTLAWSTTYQLLRHLGLQDAEDIRALGRDPSRLPFVRFDNTQQYHKPTSRRIGVENQMRVGVAATVAEAFDFEPAVVDLEDKRRRVANSARGALTLDAVLDLVDFEGLDLFMILQWVQTLVLNVPQLSHLRHAVAELFKTHALLPVPPRKTCFHALATVSKNEAVTTDLRDAIFDFLEQVGQSGESFVKRLIPVGGDGLSYEKLLQLRNLLQFQDDDLQRLDIIMPFLETWHTQWTHLSTIVGNHWGALPPTDPSRLGHSANAINQKPPRDLAKVDYYPTLYTTFIVLDGRMLDCWRIAFGVDDLQAHFDALPQDKLPRLSDLQAMAQDLHNKYSTRAAYLACLDGDEAFGSWPRSVREVEVGDPGSTPGEEEVESGSRAARATEADAREGEYMEEVESGSRVGRAIGTDARQDGYEEEVESGSRVGRATQAEPREGGDKALAQSILFMTDAMLARDASEAVAHGDVGRLWNDMKYMTFIFAGSSHPKYCTYLLEMICDLELESSPALKEFFLKNWLVNPSGEAGRTQEGDLFEEHINRELEDAIGRKGHEWDSPFIRDVIARNVHHFVELKREWGSGFGLVTSKGTHPEPHSRPELRKLAEVYRESELHRFIPGRVYDTRSPAPVDMFTRGCVNLDTDKIRTFVTNTTRARLMALHRSRADVEPTVANPTPTRARDSSPESLVDAYALSSSSSVSDRASEEEDVPERGPTRGNHEEPDEEVRQHTRGRVTQDEAGALRIEYEDDYRADTDLADDWESEDGSEDRMNGTGEGYDTDCDVD